MSVCETRRARQSLFTRLAHVPPYMIPTSPYIPLKSSPSEFIRNCRYPMQTHPHIPFETKHADVLGLESQPEKHPSNTQGRSVRFKPLTLRKCALHFHFHGHPRIRHITKNYQNQHAAPWRHHASRDQLEIADRIANIARCELHRIPVLRGQLPSRLTYSTHPWS